MNRREFIAGLTGLAVAPDGLWAEVAKARRLRIGVLTDIHIEHNLAGGEMVRKAFAYFRDEGVDAVVISGDLANKGTYRSLKELADAWWTTFPDGKRPDGSPVEKIFVFGNHDLAEFKDMPVEERIVHKKEQFWQELFCEPFLPFYTKEVKDHTFIASHWRKSFGGHDFGGHDFEAKELPEYLKANEARLGKTRPFFFVQHCHPRNTCCGTDVWWPDSGKYTTDVLKRFPNAICFSGHDHRPLTDEKGVWQDTFTSVNAGTLRETYSLGYGKDIKYFGEKLPEDKMHFDFGFCSTGVLVDVCDDCLTIRRMYIRGMQKLGDDWVLPFPARGGADGVRARPGRTIFPQKTLMRPPAYAVQPEVKISREPFVFRYGTPAEESLRLEFPAVAQDDPKHSRVYGYDVTLTPMGGADGTGGAGGARALPGAAKTFRIRSAAADFPLSCEPPRVVVHLKAAEVPSSKTYKTHIVPFDCFRTPATST